MALMNSRRTRRAIQRRILQTASVACFLVSLGCVRVDVHERLDADVRIHDRNAVLFFVDGLDRERLLALTDAARAPHIQSHFIESGLHFSNATACFPTVTYPNAVSLMTGRFPGRHGITANAWFDRMEHRCVDYATALTYLDVDRDYTAKTIYEILAPSATSSAQCAAARGATWRFQAPLANGFSWAFRDYEAVDRRAGGRIHDVIRRARREREWPVFQTYYFPAVDKVAHTHGVASARYADAVANVDAIIGDVISTIDAVAGPGKTHYWLVSDHGQMNCAGHRHLDLAGLIRERTKRNVIMPLRGKVSDATDIAFIPGRRHALIHVRGPTGWTDNPDDAAIRQVVDALCESPGRERRASKSNARVVGSSIAITPGIRCIYYRLRDHLVGVLDSEGERVISRVPQDASSNTQNRASHFDREVTALFESSRAGDVIVFADDHWVFQSKDCGGHGGASLRERQIPLYVKGPDIKSGIECDDHVRIIDVMPTIVDLLGMRDRLPADLDGESVAPRIRRLNSSVGSNAEPDKRADSAAR